MVEPDEFSKGPSRSPVAQLKMAITLCVCVFLCIPSLSNNENPDRSETSVREELKITYASKKNTIQTMTSTAEEQKRGTENTN